MSQGVTGSIVTFNNEKIIEKTVTSLLDNTKGVDFKLYVVDNTSTDGTVGVIKDKLADRGIEIIETGTNRGFGAGHNRVISIADSKYHVIMNPDVIIKDDVISKMAEYMDKNEDIGLLSPRILFPDGRDQILGKRNPKIRYLVASRKREWKICDKTMREYAMLDRDMSTSFDIENATGCFMMIRTELLKKLGGFDEKYFLYFEDCDITRAVRQTCRAVYYPEAVVYHVWGRESKKNVRLMITQIKSMLYYFRKWS